MYINCPTDFNSANNEIYFLTTSQFITILHWMPYVLWQSNPLQFDSLLNSLFRLTTKKTSKFCITMREIHWWLVDPPHKGPLIRVAFPNHYLWARHRISRILGDTKLLMSWSLACNWEIHLHAVAFIRQWSYIFVTELYVMHIHVKIITASFSLTYLCLCHEMLHVGLWANP